MYDLLVAIRDELCLDVPLQNTSARSGSLQARVGSLEAGEAVMKCSVLRCAP